MLFVSGVAVGGLIFLSACASPEAPARARASETPAERSPLRLAVTFDDLPWVGPLPPGDTDAEAALDRIAAVLRVHGAPATGFVVCDHAARAEAALRTWTAWGNVLGNHSAAHRDLDRTAVKDWLAEVRRCDEYLGRFGSSYAPYFRFPMLHQGDTADTRERARSALGEMGLSTAHVTVDTSDWILTQVHARALATGDAVLRHAVGRELVRHVGDAVEHADRVARRKVGRSVPLVLLLHANSLVDDHLDALLLALAARGIEFVTLEQALSDPVYRRPDDYVGPRGLSWLYRMRPLSVDDARWDDAEAEAIRQRFAPALAADDDEGSSGRKPSRYLAVRTPEGFDAVFAEAAKSQRMRSLLVMRRGRLVAEAYFNGAGPQTPANLKSITKSLTSALVGVALREGWIESVDDPIGRYLPGLSTSHSDKANITLRQLLTMSSGLRPVHYGDIQQSSDWVDTLLTQPIDDASPGKFVYDTPVLQLLTAVLRDVSGIPVSELARREFLAPMGGELSYWRVDAQNLELGGNDAYLRPRDLIRVGELYRRGGRFAGRHILPPKFVRDSLAVQIVPESERINHGTLPVRGYGYLWWLLEVVSEPVYAALGHGGQILLVSPRRDLVVVMTSRWPGPSSIGHYQHLTRVLIDHVLAAFPARESRKG